MKILILQDDIPPEARGGAGVVAYNLAKAFKSSGHEVRIICATQNKDSESSQIQEGIEIHKIYSQYHRRWRAYFSIYNPQTVKKAAQIISDIKPDVVHAHNVHFHLSYHCLKVAKLSGARVFLTAHDVMLFNYGKIKIPEKATCDNFMNYCRPTSLDQLKEYGKRYNPFRSLVIERYINKYVDKIFAVSEALKKVLILNGINNVEVVYNGLDVSEYETSPEKVAAFKKEHNLENKKVILFAGRISEEKGAKQAESAFKLVAKEIPDSVLAVAGSADYKFKIDDKIKFLDWLNQEDMKLALAASDVVVFPSICFETFGMVALEAMSAKKPVVATCFGGVSEVVMDGQTGYIVNPYKVTKMADRISDLLEDQAKNGEFGRRGHECAKVNFNLDRQTAEYLNFYKEHPNV